MQQVLNKNDTGRVIGTQSSGVVLKLRVVRHLWVILKLR